MTRQILVVASACAGFMILLAATISPGIAADAPPRVVPPPCAACHLPNGSGVPGVFPPLQNNLRTLAATPAGRRYIVLAVTQGLTGPLMIDGKRFNGVMPAQPLLDNDIARILNGLIGPGQRPFTKTEVKGIRASGAQLDSVRTGQLRPKAEVR